MRVLFTDTSLKLIGCAALGLLLVSCSSSRPTPQGGSNVVRAKPGLDINRAHKDGAPWWDVDVSKIPDATPTVHTGNYKANPYTVLGKTYFPDSGARRPRPGAHAQGHGPAQSGAQRGGAGQPGVQFQ